MNYVLIKNGVIDEISDAPISLKRLVTPAKTETKIIEEAVYEDVTREEIVEGEFITEEAVYEDRVEPVLSPSRVTVDDEGEFVINEDELETIETTTKVLVTPERQVPVTEKITEQILITPVKTEQVVIEEAVYETVEGEVIETDLPIEIDWIYENGTFTPPLARYKQDALAGVDKEHAETLRKLTGSATVEERDTWQSKALAAQAIKDGTATPSQTLMIGTEASLSGKAVEDLVNSILANNEKFMGLIGFAAGHRSATRAAINEAETLEELEAVIISARTEAASIISRLN